MRTGGSSVHTERSKGLVKIKTIGWIAIIAVVFVLLLVIVMPLYLSSNSGKSFILGKINRFVNGKVGMGDFSMGWYKGIRVRDLTFEDDSGATSARIKEFSTKPHYMPLLLGIVALGETLIDEPQVIINVKGRTKDTDGKTAPPGEKTAAEKEKNTRLALAKVDLTVKGGNLSIIPESGQRDLNVLKVSNIGSKLDLNPLGQKSTFDVAIKVADGRTESKISAKGNLTPSAKKSWTLKQTSGDFTVKVENLDLETLGPFFALAGREIDAAGILNGDITAGIDDGRFEKLQASAVLSGFEKDIRGKKTAIAEPVTMDAQISSDDKNIIIDKLNLKSSFCTIDCGGGINSVDYEATADLAGLQAFAGQFIDFGDYTIAGRATETGKISFDDKKITVRGQAVIEQFIAGNGKKATPASSVDMDFVFGVDTEGDLLNINSFQTTADFGRVKIADSVVPLGEQAAQKLGLGIKADIDLQKAQPFIELVKPLAEGMTISGKLKSDLSVAGENRKLTVATDSTQITDARINLPGKKPFEEKLISIFADVLLDFTEKTYQIRDLRIDSSQIDVTGNLTQTGAAERTKLSGRIDAEYDLAAASAIAGAFIPTGLTMEGKRTTDIEIESEYNPAEKGSLLANLNTQAKFGFDKATYKGLHFGPTELQITVKQGDLSIEPFSATVNNGKLNLAGAVNLKEKPVLFKISGPMRIIEKVNINDDTSRQLLMYLNPVFADAVNVRGVADFYCEKLSIPLEGAAKGDAVVAGTVSIEKMRLEASDLLAQIVSVTGGRGVDMTMMPTKFVLQKGFLSYDDMQINVGENPVNFAGKIGLDKSLDMNVTLPYTFSGGTVKEGESVADRIKLPIEGTLDNPKINVQKLLESEAIRQGLRLLEKVLK